jgi:hypothetical protein
LLFTVAILLGLTLTWLFRKLLIVADLEAVRGTGFSGRGVILLVATTQW